jgi:hypothetical protein
MEGLLGEGWNDPKSSAMMALAGGLLQGNFGAGVVGASNAYQGMQDSLLKRKLMQQDIQQHDISLQQAQQQWDIMQPALKAWAAQSQSQGQPPVASQPAIAPSQGGGLGSGSYGIPTGGQSAVAPSASAPSGDPFSLNNVVTGSMISRFGGPAAGSAYWERSKLPDSVKTNQFYGIDPASVTASMNRENAAKGNMLVRNQSTIARTNPDGSITPLFTAPDTKNNVNLTWQNGSPQASPIPGVLESMQGVSRAQTAGAGQVLPYAGVSATGAPMPITNRTAAATQGQDNPNIPPSTPAERGASDVAALQRQISQVKGSLTPASTKNMQLEILNQEMVKAQAQATTAPAAPSAIYAAPPMGAVTNADAANKASAQTMHESYARLQSGGATANSAIEVIDKMLSLANKKWPVTAGYIATHQDAINPEAAEYGKQRANLNILMAQQGGTNGSDAGRALTGDSIPDYGKPKSAIADGLGTLRNQIILGPLKRDLVTQAYQSGDSKKYTTLENQFDQNISPSMVPLLTMPAGTQRATALKAAAQNPQTKARLEWAAQNGLFK